MYGRFYHHITSKVASGLSALFATITLTTLGAELHSASAYAPSQGQDTHEAATQERHAPKPYVQLEHPSWSRSAVLYQVNVRQFSDSGSFKAVEDALPRLEALGVDILWLMPIHPIGKLNRKGSLGSYYAVQDYRAVNPEFGTLEDLKSLVAAAHKRGMHVILDWVANHTAWDNVLVESHPDWYERDEAGNFRPTPWVDWSDIIDLDFSKPGLRRYMADAMAYWVRDVGIDGFRADVAGYVPLDFWEELRRELDAIKPVFMLAEWETRDLHARAFDATYGWSFANALKSIADGAGADALFGYYSGHHSTWPKDGYRMSFTSNHDYNSWHGTDAELYGDAFSALTVMTFVAEGIPLIYNGQEAGLDKRLAFFEKDPIAWQPHANSALYKTLTGLKHSVKALHNGTAGADMVYVANTAPKQVFSFTRFGASDGVFAVLNLSAEPADVRFTGTQHLGPYRDAFTGENVVINADTNMNMPAWSWRIFTRQMSE